MVYLAVRTKDSADRIRPYLYDGEVVAEVVHYRLGRLGYVVEHHGESGFGPIAQCARFVSGLIGCTDHKTMGGALAAFG